MSEPSVRFYCRHCGGEVAECQRHEPEDCRRVKQRAAALQAAKERVVEAAIAECDAEVAKANDYPTPGIIVFKVARRKAVADYLALRDGEKP